MIRVVLFGLCLAASVTADGLKPDEIVPIEDPGAYPVEEPLIEYIQDPYLPQYQERPRFDKEIIYYQDQPKYAVRYPKYQFKKAVEEPIKDKPPAIQIYVV